MKTVRGDVIDAGKTSNRKVYTEYFLFWKQTKQETQN